MASVLITGAASGFGLDSAILLAKNGFEVVASVRLTSDLTALKKASELSNLHIEYLDVNDVIEDENLVLSLAKKYGGFDVVICNAGILSAGLADGLAMEKTEAMVRTNLIAQIAIVHALLPQMKERKQGKIIFISSLAARRPLPFLSSYNATKAGIEGYAKSLYLELAIHGIEVFLIEPGFYQTHLWDEKNVYQDPEAEKLNKMSLSSTSPRDRKEVSFQILKIALGKEKRFHLHFGLFSRLQILVSPLIYTGIGKKLYSWYFFRVK